MIGPATPKTPIGGGKPPPVAWHFPRVRLINAHDGDTLKVEVDHGFRIYSTQDLRIEGIDCPEMTGATPEERRAADVARLTTNELLLREGPWFDVVVKKVPEASDAAYGRFLADVRLVDAALLSERLIEWGHARRAAKGGKRQPWTLEDLAALNPNPGPWQVR